MSGSDFTKKGSPIHLVAPEKPGEYEVRYETGQRSRTLARAKLTVVGVAASIEAPASVVAGTNFRVKWKGPGGEFDRINIAKQGSPDRKSVDSDYTLKGSPLGLRAPADAGEYELRYQTAQSGSILARAPLTVTAAPTVPGMIRVTAAAKPAAEGGGGVEIILDGSGSMLAKIGSQRRIDIAKRTLAKLTSEIIPAGTPFALRVIGRGSDSCQSELDVPFGPLDRASAGAKIAALQAKNGAKTPIGASLEKVATDMSSVQGERLVILVTDGQETCGGNPAKAIQKLAASGVDVRVNIVGFAVDDQKVAATFDLWATDRRRQLLRRARRQGPGRRLLCGRPARVRGHRREEERRCSRPGRRRHGACAAGHLRGDREGRQGWVTLHHRACRGDHHGKLLTTTIGGRA